MKNRLVIGTITGAAVGAAASYLMDSKDRNALVSNIKDLGSKAMDLIGNIPGFTGETPDVRATATKKQMPKRG